MQTLQQKLIELSTLTSENCKTRSLAIAEEGEKSAHQLMLWLHYLRTTQLTGNADCLIDATANAIREAISCLALGLVRPALNSLRLQIDLSLSWIYFKDHPVEWQRVQETGDGFKLKKELLKYYGDSFPKYSNRIGILNDIATRPVKDPYRLLSAHIHGQSESTLPTTKEPKDIVGTVSAQDEVILLQAACSEYISDILWSLFADRWASLPLALSEKLGPRFKTMKQKNDFYS